VRSYELNELSQFNGGRDDNTVNIQIAIIIDVAVGGVDVCLVAIARQLRPPTVVIIKLPYSSQQRVGPSNRHGMRCCGLEDNGAFY